MTQIKFALFSVLALLTAGAPLSWAQNARETTPEARQQARPIAPFAADIACEVVLSPIPNSTHLRHLYARNTLAHALPAGTRLSWSYVQFGIPSHRVSGDRVLDATVPRSGLVATGVELQGMLNGEDCEMRARYGGPPPQR